MKKNVAEALKDKFVNFEENSINTLTTKEEIAKWLMQKMDGMKDKFYGEPNTASTRELMCREIDTMFKTCESRMVEIGMDVRISETSNFCTIDVGDTSTGVMNVYLNNSAKEILEKLGI